MRCACWIPLLLLAACNTDPPHVASVKTLVQRVSPEQLEANVQALAGFGTRHTASETKSDERGIGAARRWIQERLEAIAEKAKSPMTVEMQRFVPPRGPRMPNPVEIVNVVATLQGTDPVEAERVYVVSGHYDSRALNPLDATSDAPGANDDASGTAAVIELARIFAQEPPPATLVFLCVAGEEQGLIGSRHFAKDARANDVRIEGMITNDIVGNSIGRDGKPNRSEVRLFSEGIPRRLLGSELPQVERDRALRIAASVASEWDSPSRQLARFIHDAAKLHVATMTVRLVFRPDRFLRGGDHLPFNEQGYAGVRFTEPFENYDRQHQDVRTEEGRDYGDVAARVDVLYLERVTQINLAALAALAWGPPPPRNVRLMAQALENDSTLVWEEPPGKRIAGYEVVWRDTTKATWTDSKRVGKVTETTLPLGKDDFHFGLRSVDKAGRLSPVVFPVPVRRPR